MADSASKGGSRARSLGIGKTRLCELQPSSGKRGRSWDARSLTSNGSRGNEEGLAAAIQPRRCCFEPTNVLDSCAVGALPRLKNQSLDTFGWTGNRRFHGAVCAVAHPAAYAGSERAAAEPLPIANSLDPSGNADVQLHAIPRFSVKKSLRILAPSPDRSQGALAATSLEIDQRHRARRPLCLSQRRILGSRRNPSLSLRLRKRS